MITAVFTDGNDYANTCGLWQWDYGQELRIQGLDLPKAVEIHFALKETGSEALIRVGVTSDGVTTVTIPDSMLEGAESTYDYKIFAWIYLADPNTGETIKKIVIPVKSRSKPEAFDSPEDREIFEEAIKAVNGAVNRAEELANDAIEVGEEAKEAAVKAEECLEEAQKLAGQIVENVKDEAVKAVETKGTEQIGIVAAEGKKQLDEIARVMATIPEDYTALDQHVQDLDSALNTKAPAIRLEANVQNGGPTELPMPGDSGLHGLTVYGKSTQVVTTGAQLITDVKYGVTSESNGITFKVFEDGSVNIKGTNTSANDVFLSFMSQDSVNDLGELDSGKYFLSGNVKGSNVILQFWQSNLPVIIDDGNGAIVDYKNNGQKFNISALVKPGVSVNDVTIYPMFNKGETALPFEPYTGGMPAPNPNYPQEIESVGEEVGIEVANDNWFMPRYKTTVYNGITYTANEAEGSIHIKGTNTSTENTYQVYSFADISLKNLPDGEYCISGIPKGINDDELTVYIQVYNPSDNNGVSTTKDIGNGAVFNFKRNNNATQNIAFGVAPGKTVDITIKPMLNKGNKPLPFVVRRSEASIIPTPNGLPGIPVTSGGNYTDKDGQQWVCDTIEWDRVSGTGEYVKRVEKVDYEKLKFVDYVNGDDTINYNRINYNSGIKYDSEQYIGRTIPTMCNKFVEGPRKINNYGCDTVSDSGWNGYSRYEFCIDKSITKEKFETEILPTLVIITKMKEPIRTPLTADQIKSLESLCTFHPTSIISNDAGADMQVIYAADTKAYIDSKIDALSKTILDAIGGK